jgi:hypothetical protein
MDKDGITELISLSWSGDLDPTNASSLSASLLVFTPRRWNERVVPIVNEAEGVVQCVTKPSSQLLSDSPRVEYIYPFAKDWL